MNHNRRQTTKATAVAGVFGLCLLTQSLWPLLGAWLMLLMLLIIPNPTRKPRRQPTAAERREARRQRLQTRELQRLGVGYATSGDNGG